MQRHRVTTSTGAVVDEPTVGELADLAAEVDRSGRHGFLFLERRDADLGRSYLQASRERTGWLLELHAGNPAHHVEARVADTALVHTALASWTLGAHAWRGLDWQHRGPRPQLAGLVSGG